jgi:Putative zinc-finger
MCEFSEKLIAWIDQELEGDGSAHVERHVRNCAECRAELEKYRRVSGTFDAYCDGVMEANAAGRTVRWVPAMSVAAAVIFVAALLVFVLNTRVKPLVPPAAKMSSPNIALETRPVAAPESRPVGVAQMPPTARRTIHRRHEPVQVQNENVSRAPAEPAIEIVMPAESIFPPGAVPDGFVFTADLSIAADGSAQQIRLRPQLIGFERSVNQP